MKIIDSQTVKKLAAEAGFDLCGIAEAGPIDGFGQRLGQWLGNGLHGEMGYMERNADKRADPRLLVEGARSVVSVAVAYKPDRVMTGNVKVAQYAYTSDYHEVMKSRLFRLIAAVKAEWPEFEAKACVDTAPISDKLWAVRAGLGWIGRNTLLVTPQYGSYVNLGELVTSSEFDVYDTPMENRCGSCRRCVEVCPGRALDHSESLGIDAPQCTAYQTIEGSEVAPRSPQGRKGYVFGCDLCQLACPYCAGSPAVRHIDDTEMRRLASLAAASEDDFRRLTRHTALDRITYDHWKRNIAPNNTEQPG